MRGVLLLVHQNLAKKISHLLSSFAAGALLSTAFFDLIPEALGESDRVKFIMGRVLAGMLIFFLMERFIHWFHHHHEHKNGNGNAAKPIVPLIIFGDTLHNFIDGLAIGGAFLVSSRLGIVTALATSAHEIPQEIGDFGVLLNQGMNRGKVLWYNFLSALATIVGAVLVYFSADLLKGRLPQLLGLTAGFFIYIAASDLIPEIHNRDNRGFALAETSLLFLGVIFVWWAIQLLGA